MKTEDTLSTILDEDEMEALSNKMKSELNREYRETEGDFEHVFENSFLKEVNEKYDVAINIHY